MGRVDNSCAFWNFVQFVNEDRALLGQVGYDVAVMHNLFANIDRRAEGIQRDLNDVDGSHNAGAEAARLEKEYPLGFRFAAALVNRDVLESGCSHIHKYTALTPPLELL